MTGKATIGEYLGARSISRRAFLKFCAGTASLLTLPPGSAATIAQALERVRRQSVIWLSFQECTGCTESLTRSQAPRIENLILDFVSLDYHHTLQAASGEAAEAARRAAMREHAGRYLVVVDGSIPTRNDGACSTIAGISNVELLHETVRGAAAVIAVGTCAAFGGLPAAAPNPTGAVPVSQLVGGKPLINVPGCPPLPEVMAAVLVHYLVFGRFPELDEIGRPRSFYGETVHDRCSRRAFFDQKQFAESFDDEGARSGWCLYKLGCKGPVTFNACATLKWNGGVSFPIESGHPCLGCSEPGFWDRGSFYASLAAVALPEPGAAGQTPAARGAALYGDNCAYCHGQDPGALHTPVEQVPQVLRSGSVRAHRLKLDDTELRDLTDYLSAERRLK
jgi:hydrogenase small subunit